MIERAASGVFPPAKVSLLPDPIFSISLALSPEIVLELHNYAKEDRTSWSKQAENALMFYRESFMTIEDHARENIIWAMRHFGPPEPLKRSAKQQEHFERILSEELSHLKASGAVGELFLPEELYQFVVRNIEQGKFDSASEVMTAAIPFLRAERGKSPRAEFLDPRFH